MTYKELDAYCSERKTRLVAVSKKRSIDEIKGIYDQGQRIFAENRVQEWQDKKDLLPADIQWHLIGHLQTNKVKYVIPSVDLIQSVDRLNLLKKIIAESESKNCVTSILIQYKVAEEESKFGLDPQNDEELLFLAYGSPQILVKGIMGMGSFTSDQTQLSSEFENLHSIFDRLKQGVFKENLQFNYLSMGMSGDYKLAIEKGSNMVRIGSLLFT